MTLNLYVKTNEKRSFIDEIGDAFIGEYDTIDSFIFASPKTGLFLDEFSQIKPSELYNSLMKESVDCNYNLVNFSKAFFVNVTTLGLNLPIFVKSTCK